MPLAARGRSGKTQHAGCEKWAYAKHAGSVTSPPQNPADRAPVIDLAFHILVLLFLAAFLAGFIDSIAGGTVPRGKAILRSTAKPGDIIFVTGKLGGAAGG